MRTISIRMVRTKKDLEKAHEIRRKVFVEEQKVDPRIEIDKYEGSSRHFLIYWKNKPVGTCRIRFPKNSIAKLERLAVLKGYRGKGLGKAGTKHMVKYCKRMKITEIYMNAQYYLKNFYSSLGFFARGKPFMEAGIKHIKMYYGGE